MGDCTTGLGNGLVSAENAWFATTPVEADAMVAKVGGWNTPQA
jgi:hypothetical protein